MNFIPDNTGCNVVSFRQDDDDQWYQLRLPVIGWQVYPKDDLASPVTPCGVFDGSTFYWCLEMPESVGSRRWIDLVDSGSWASLKEAAEHLFRERAAA